MHVSALLATLAVAAFSSPASALTAANSTVLRVAPDGTGEGCFLLPNTDREGSDLSNVRGPLDSCYATCAATSGCRTFTWSNFNGGTCWLKSSGSRPIEKAGVTGYTCLVDATSSPPADPNCYYLSNTDRLGFDLSNSRGPLNSCYAKCKATANCQTFTWSDYQGGTCWLKSYGSRPVEKAGVIGYSCLFDKPTNVCSLYKDIDFVGMDIGSRLGSPTSCCGECAEIPGCTAYAWTSFNGGTCWMKKSVGQTEYKPGVISSSLLPLYGGVCAAEYNIDFVGNDIGNKPSVDAGVCCGQCKATAGCKSYTWSNHNGGTCWMKSGKGATAAKAGVTSATIAIF